MWPLWCDAFSVPSSPGEFLIVQKQQQGVQFVPLDEVVEQVLDSLLQLGLLQGDRVAFVGDLYDQFPQFVQLPFDLEEALGGQSEPEEKKADVTQSLPKCSGLKPPLTCFSGFNSLNTSSAAGRDQSAVDRRWRQSAGASSSPAAPG